VYDNDDALTEPTSEDVATFESSRKRLYMEQVFDPHEFLAYCFAPLTW